MAQVASVLVVTPDSLLFSSLGDAARLEAVALDAGGSALEGTVFTWSSSDAAVAAADSAGLVAAMANGTTTVSATVDGVSGSAAVTVAQVASVLIVAPDSLLFASLGDTARLEAVALDAGGSAVEGAAFTWNSSADSVASVDERGLVRALSPGTAEITAAHGAATGAATVVVSRPAPLTDRDALEALYRAAGGTAWTNADGWLSEAPLGQWHGIETDDSGSVTAVRLPENGLAGGIPPELGYLAHLERLNLRENNLTGPLPPEIGLAVRLREIDLGHTELEGAIPATLGRLVDLRHLNFEYVPFTGSIPPELGALEELEFLNLYRNRLTGPLPPELAGLRNLRTMYVDENGLTGSVSPAFADLTQLRVFYWGNNNGLCAPATPDFETWRGDGRNARGPRCNEADVAALEHLYHRTGGPDWTNSAGWLEGPAVELWHGVGADSLGHVTLLDLSANEVRGRLPGALGELGRLSVLRVGDNPLSGPLPQSLDALALKEFRYGDTEMCVPRSRYFRQWLDAIPIREGTDEPCPPLSDREVLEELYDATGGTQWWRRDGWLTEAPLEKWHGVTTDDDGRVVELALYGNNLRGRAPAELGQLDRLRLVDLSYNWLRGPIPPDLTDIETLEEIYLESNLLEGPIPRELGALSALTALYLWNNRLEGSIPPELGDLSALEDLRISYNRLTGRIPPELGNLSRVVVIWMDNNELEGEIPPELGNLSSILTFYLGFNRLSGEIPPEFGNLPRVWALALDYNDLTGPIPVELGQPDDLGRGAQPDRQPPVREHSRGVEPPRCRGGSSARPQQPVRRASARARWHGRPRVAGPVAQSRAGRTAPLDLRGPAEARTLRGGGHRAVRGRGVSAGRPGGLPAFPHALLRSAAGTFERVPGPVRSIGSVPGAARGRGGCAAPGVPDLAGNHGRPDPSRPGVLLRRRHGGACRRRARPVHAHPDRVRAGGVLARPIRQRPHSRLRGASRTGNGGRDRPGRNAGSRSGRGAPDSRVGSHAGAGGGDADARN